MDRLGTWNHYTQVESFVTLKIAETVVDSRQIRFMAIGGFRSCMNDSH